MTRPARVDTRQYPILSQSGGMGGVSIPPTITDLDTILAASAGEDIADALTGANAPDAGNVFATMADVGGGSGGLTLLEQHTASSSATLDFASFISSTYDEYVFELINIYPATNDVGLRVRMGTGGGPTYDTGNNYAWAVFIWRAGGSAANGVETAGDYIGLNYGAGGTLGVSNTGNYNGYSGTARLFAPQSSVYKAMKSEGQYLDAESFRIGVTGRASYESTTAITAVRFYFSSGNITSGTIRAYGLAK